MTVTYTSEVADCKNFGCFWKLLFRWRGSIYKLVWPDLLAYSFFYFLLSGIYRFVLQEEGRRLFENISLYTQTFTELIPIAFVLGFYVSIVVQRWWAQYEVLPWPDSLSLYITTSIPSNDDKGRMMRRTIVRYANLAFTLTLIMISPKMKKRFPTLDHLVEAGLLTSNEKKIFDDMSSKTTHPTYWMPFVWAGTVVARARKEGRIRDDFAVKTIIDEINRLRGLCGSLLSYDWISIPLVYTQVVTLAVYSFFLATLMGRQFLDPKKNYLNNNLDIVFPIFTYLQFFFYMGWLKVAESLVNPFGEDDDDFEINWLVDRNVQVSYLIVDEMHNEHPDLIQDIYWEEVFPSELPYTVASQEFRREPPHGSTANLEIPAQDQEVLPMVEEETKEELLGENADGQSGSTINTFRRIGSNLSVSHQTHGIAKRPSILSFLQRSTNSIRKSSGKKSVQRLNSKSSDATLSPGTNRTGSHVYNMSEVSFSGSEGVCPETYYPNSSKESLNGDQRRSPGDRRRTRRRTEGDDIGIVFGIKETNEEESSFEPSIEDERRGSDHGILIEPNRRKSGVFWKERSVSIDTGNPEKQETFDEADYPPESPSKAMQYLRLPFTSSSGVARPSVKESPLTSSPKRAQSFFPSQQRKEMFQTRKPVPRGSLLRNESFDVNSKRSRLDRSTPPLTPTHIPSVESIPEIPPTFDHSRMQRSPSIEKPEDVNFYHQSGSSGTPIKEKPPNTQPGTKLTPKHISSSSETIKQSDYALYPPIYPDISSKEDEFTIHPSEIGTPSKQTPTSKQRKDNQEYTEHSPQIGASSSETVIHMEPSTISPSSKSPPLQLSDSDTPRITSQDTSKGSDNSSEGGNLRLNETIWL